MQTQRTAALFATAKKGEPCGCEGLRMVVGIEDPAAADLQAAVTDYLLGLGVSQDTIDAVKANLGE